jgi:hypothetical protein
MRKAVLLAIGLALIAAPVIAAEAPLKIGLAAMISPKDTVKYYGQMLEYVGKKLGRPVEMVQEENYDLMDGMLEKREVDIAFLCAGPYVKDKDKFGAELLVAPQSYGQPFYHSYILGRSEGEEVRLHRSEVQHRQTGPDLHDRQALQPDSGAVLRRREHHLHQEPRQVDRGGCQEAGRRSCR